MNDFSERLASAPTLERYSDLSPEEFERNWGKPQKPVILVDAIEHWAARQWTPESFARKWGDKIFEIDGEECTLTDHIDRVLASTEDSPAPYLKNINVKSDFKELLPDIQPELMYSLPNRLDTRLVPKRILLRGEGRYTQLFIGGAGRSFPRLHWDSPPFLTWSALMCGKKEWILFAPEDTENLYVQQSGSDVSRVQNVYDVDLDKFPKMANTRPIKVIQQPGEVLFVPAGWWHTAKNLEPSITIAWDQLSGSTWSEFVDHFLSQRPGRPVKSLLLRAYFQLVGFSLNVGERLGVKI